MAYGFIPTACRKVTVTFIPKPEKVDYTEAKVYRPISLLSFLLKTMHELVDRHIRDSASRRYPLHRNQHAYQIGKSTKTELHNVVTCTESATEYEDIALGAFFNIEAVFDRTSFDTIKQAAERDGTEPTICRWICAMLESRNITATLSGESLRASAGRGAFASAVESGRGMIFFGGSTMMVTTQ
jgi:hypothetical protein